MMGKIGIKAAADVPKVGQERVPPQQLELSEEDKSKDAFFVQIAQIGEAMIARHGKDFAIGTLVLSAKFIAEGKPLINRDDGGGETVNTVKPV
jgi:hypothetical protein